MANRKVKKSSPLDDITPERWTFSDEVIELLTVLEKTVELTLRWPPTSSTGSWQGP